MKDEDFDLLLIKQMQIDTYIPEKINHLFSNFEREVILKKNRKIKVIDNIRRGFIAASSILVMFLGGCTYAHVNGTETIISPLLRNLGINSKYEENSTKFDEETTKQNVKIKMLDGAIDDTTLIIGYEVELKDIDLDSWIEIEGHYKINDTSIIPINTSIDRTSDKTFVCYQIFDVNELKIADNQNVKIDADIYRIREYTECEDIDSAYAVYGKVYEDTWSLKENIDIKKLTTSKTYELQDAKSYEIAKNLKVSVTEFITGSYTNILKVKTDRTGYKGDQIEKYYKILDEKDNEIGMFKEEERQYDEISYNDRLVTGKVNKDSKIKLEVYARVVQTGNFKKVATIPVNLTKAVEKNTQEARWKEYKNDRYAFKYRESWNLISELDETDVGSNSAYVGALELEIPSTTNSERTSSIYIKTVKTSATLEEYVKKEKKQNTEEYAEVKSTSRIKNKNQDGYQVVYEFSDGETIYIQKSTYLSVDNGICTVTFWGSEKEYNNLKNDINKFLENFNF